jgi:uncharacterized protein (DUF2235 family)
MLGVWYVTHTFITLQYESSLTLCNRDTVASVGYLIPRTLPLTSNNSVEFFRHAVSLDEHRKRFGVEQWDPQPPEDPDSLLPEAKRKAPPDVKEVWFSGCHCGK